MPLVTSRRARLRVPARVQSHRLTYAPTRSRRLNEICGLLVLACAVLLLLGLLTYSPSDPSFNTVGGGTANPARPTHNWIGLTGAYYSDLTLQFLGIASLLLPLFFGLVGASWMRSRRVGSPLVKSLGLLLWITFAPAGAALLPIHALWQNSLPLGGVEGRILADVLIRLLNAPGAAILTGTMVFLSLYLATSFAFGTAPQYAGGPFAFLRTGREKWALWRYRRSNPGTTGVLAHTATSDPGALDSVARTPKDSLLYSLLRTFSRKRSAENPSTSELEACADPEQVSLWDGMPRTDVDAPHLEGLAAASAAAAPFAAQLAAASSPLRSPQVDAGHDAHPEQVTAPSSQVVATPHHEDDWLNSPERQIVNPLLKGQPEPGSSNPPNSGPRLVRRSTPPAPETDSHAYTGPTPLPDPLPAPEPPVPPIPQPFTPRERIAAARPAAAAAFPAATADIRAQNIAFGERADAHQLKGFLPVKSVRGYQLPPSSLLHVSEGHTTVREDALRAEAQVLVEKCAEFGVAGRVEQINPGPVVTTYEFRPDAGVKYSRVTGLADDLCLAMAAESVLIERMAGKSTVGIQVPNHERETIWLRDVVESEHFANTKSRLPIALGKDIDGRIVCADLASMPHVLIAGSTGSGKSVAINAMIMSVLFRSTPEQVRMILVDPKARRARHVRGHPTSLYAHHHRSQTSRERPEERRQGDGAPPQTSGR